jgi:hypothetical protein
LYVLDFCSRGRAKEACTQSIFLFAGVYKKFQAGCSIVVYALVNVIRVPSPNSREICCRNHAQNMSPLYRTLRMSTPTFQWAMAVKCPISMTCLLRLHPRLHLHPKPPAMARKRTRKKTFSPNPECTTARVLPTMTCT